MKLNSFSAVIFDLDGLVLDSESTYHRAWQQAAQDMGYYLPDSFCQSLLGLHYRDVERQLIHYCGADFNLTAFKNHSSSVWHNQVEQHGIAIKHGFAELLAWLQQQAVPYALATNSRATNAQRCLQLAGLAEVFTTLISRDDVSQGKPEPEIFHTTAAALQTPIEQCLVLEDSFAGVLAAHRAGAITVLIPSLLPVDAQTLALADAVFADLAQLLSHLQALKHGYRV